jgi:hypothetical protein
MLDGRSHPLESMVTNYIRGLCRLPHYSLRQCRHEDRLVYHQFIVEGKFGPLTKKRSKEAEFSVEVSPFQSFVGVPRDLVVQVEP